jgi:hypothetical protein
MQQFLWYGDLLRAFRREIHQSVPLEDDRFGVEFGNHNENPGRIGESMTWASDIPGARTKRGKTLARQMTFVRSTA